jgi:hypothetical protein
MVVKYKFVTPSGAPAMPALKAFMEDIKDQIRQARILLPIKCTELAEQAGRFMAQRVRLMTKRTGATDKLASALESSVHFRRSTKDNFTIGVGNSEDLPKYWAMINYGGYIKSGPLYGFWSDSPEGKSKYSKRGTGVGKANFVYLAGGNVMVPRRPIKGFQYIAYAHVRMLAYMQRNFGILKK